MPYVLEQNFSQHLVFLIDFFGFWGTLIDLGVLTLLSFLQTINFTIKYAQFVALFSASFSALRFPFAFKGSQGCFTRRFKKALFKDDAQKISKIFG